MALSSLFDELRAQALTLRIADSWHIASGIAILLILYSFVLVVYRLWFSPLAGFPGPKHLAVTTWYETLVDLFSHDFPERLCKIHAKYGPIVRVSPWELHINDADYFTTVFATTANHRTDIIPPRGLGMDDSLGSTPDHDTHQLRRRPLDKFLSRQNVVRFQSIIHDEIRILDQKLLAAKNTGTAVRLDHAFASFTGDIVGQVACGESPKLLAAPNFTPEWYTMIRGAAKAIPLLRHFPQIGSVMQYVPAGLLQTIFPNSTGFRILQLLGEKRIARIRIEVDSETKDENEQNSSMFHYLLRSDIPESEKCPTRLNAEAVSFLGAGTYPTAATLILTAYYILATPSIEDRLQKELKDVMVGFDDEVPNYVQIEQLVYLGACIKEGLRILRLFRRKGRISTDEDLHYKEWTIPKNTLVTMSAYSLHMDPDVFPDPHKFNPERWLSEDPDLRMERNLVPFLKGSRNCIGMNVAWAQMYLVLATLFRPNKRYRLSLTNCDESDIVPMIDNEFGVAKYGSRGLSARVS